MMFVRNGGVDEACSAPSMNLTHGDSGSRDLERARKREIAGYVPNMEYILRKYELNFFSRYLTAASFPIDCEDGVPSQPVMGSDPILNSLVQLGALRLNCDRAFLSLIDDCNQYICSEMTRNHPVATQDCNYDDRLYLGCCKLDCDWGVCPLTMKTFMDTSGEMKQNGPNIIANSTRYIISDFRSAPGYEERPYVTSFPFMVRYCTNLQLQNMANIMKGILPGSSLNIRVGIYSRKLLCS